MRLSELQNNQTGIITKIGGRGSFRKRIMEMGFVRGKKVKVIKNAPLNDPIEYSILGYHVSLRRHEASFIEVVSENDFVKPNTAEFSAFAAKQALKEFARENSRVINVALVGNPNSGKTTLFNYASGSREHVGNYSGVTIESKTATVKYKGYTFNLTDLPGTYSLSAYSPEELYVRSHLLEQTPDVVVNVIDSSNLERNLFLSSQLIDMDLRVVGCLNMFDELQQKGDKFDYAMLGAMIGIPLTPTVSSRGKGIGELFSTIIRVYNDKEKSLRHIHINYGVEAEASVLRLQNALRIPANQAVTDKYSSRFLALKLLEKDKWAFEIINQCINVHEIQAIAQKEALHLEEVYKEDVESYLTDAKYGFVHGALKETYKPARVQRRTITDKIDFYLTHKYLGFPIFLFFMWLMFESTFVLGEYPKSWLENVVQLLGNYIHVAFPEGSFKDLIADGIVGGVGGVIVFLPNILILFFFISVMEDTGYMARAAFIMDKIMHKVGLHGKSFIPLLMGFGCNVPAIMATRTIESRSSKLITILINPFMSCSARLPVYVLIISAFFPSYPGTVLFGIYITGVLLAALIAILFRKTMFKAKEIPFVMELPPYRIPTAKATGRHIWQKGSQYLQRMGGVILVASIIIWALGYFPQKTISNTQYDALIVQYRSQYDAKLKQTDSSTVQYTRLKTVRDSTLNNLLYQKHAVHHANSYIGRIGRFIEPVMAPCGFDWRMSVSLLMGVSAKEIVVSTLGVLHQAEDEDSKTLAVRLRESTYSSGARVGEKVITPLVAISFMLFILVYSPCIAVIASIKNESGSWKWALFSVVYSTLLAYILSFAVFQVGTFF
jgi:ferrous iron transport protein B